VIEIAGVSVWEPAAIWRRFGEPVAVGCVFVD